MTSKGPFLPKAFYDSITYGLEKLKQNLSDFHVVMTGKINESETSSSSTRLTLFSAHILKLNESMLFSREDSFTRKFLVINHLK